MAVSGRGVIWKILVSGCVERLVNVRPVLDQITVGRRDQRLQAPGRCRIILAQPLDRHDHVIVVIHAALALGEIVEALGIGFRTPDIERLQIAESGRSLPAQIVGGADAHARLVAFEAAQIGNHRCELLARLLILARGQPPVSALQDLFRRRRWILGAHGVLEQNDGGGRAYSRVGIGVAKINALIISHLALTGSEAAS